MDSTPSVSTRVLRPRKIATDKVSLTKPVGKKRQDVKPVEKTAATKRKPKSTIQHATGVCDGCGTTTMCAIFPYTSDLTEITKIYVCDNVCMKTPFLDVVEKYEARKKAQEGKQNE